MVVQLTPDNSNLQGESKKRFELLGVQVSEGEIIKKITSSKKTFTEGSSYRGKSYPYPY